MTFSSVPSISLVMPVYNREAYLAAAIGSVLAQTYADFELILWDDGSTDASLTIARQVAAHDPRVQVVAAPHQGVAIACQQAIARSKGTYLGIVDSDDQLAPTALEQTAGRLNANPALGMVYTDYVEIDSDGRIQRYGSRCSTPYSPDRLLLSFMTFHFRLLRRSAYDLVGGIHLEAGHVYDYDLCLRLSEVVSIDHLPLPLYYYRVHAHGLTASHWFEQTLLTWRVIRWAIERRGLGDRVSLELQMRLVGQHLLPSFRLCPKRSVAVLKPAAALMAALPLLNASSSLAQTIIPARDGTQTQVNRQGDRITITGGQRSNDGRNLFHSFEQFGIRPQEIATFQSNPAIQTILGRISGGNPSIINGLLQVTGGASNLVLINPSGIVFGPNSRLDLPASFTATTASGIGFANGWFSAIGANDYPMLTGDPISYGFLLGQSGAIVNAGQLAVGEGQSLTLLGSTVINTGTLAAPGGRITLAAIPGQQLVRLSQPGSLLSLEGQPWTGEGLPTTPLPPAALPQWLTGGDLQSATDLTRDPDGTVRLTRSGTAIPTEPGTAIASGGLDASCQGECAAGQGGQIAVVGDRVAVTSASLTASGTTGGGTIRVGGDEQGGNALPAARRTVVSRDSTLAASAGANGNGGRIIVWSEENTGVWGNLTARGGTTGGNGGFVEISGRTGLTYQGQVDVSAPLGTPGTVLFDPTNIRIVPGLGLNDDQLTGGQPLGQEAFQILQADGGAADFVIGAETLTTFFTGQIILQATNDIIIDPGVAILAFPGGFEFGYGPITFTADADNDGTGNFVMSSTDTISTVGRALTITGANISAGTIFNNSSFGGTGSVTLSTRNPITGDLRGTVTATAIDTSALPFFETPGGDVVLEGDRVRITGTLPESPESIRTNGYFGGDGSLSVVHAGGASNLSFVINDPTSLNGIAGEIRQGSETTLSSGTFAVAPTGGTDTPVPGVAIASINRSPATPLTLPLQTLLPDQSLTLSFADLAGPLSDPDGDQPLFLTDFTLLTADATLTLNGVSVTAATVITPADSLVYTPASTSAGTEFNGFTYRAADPANGAIAVLSTSPPTTVAIAVSPTPVPVPVPIPTPTPIPVPVPTPVPVSTPVPVPVPTPTPTPSPTPQPIPPSLSFLPLPLPLPIVSPAPIPLPPLPSAQLPAIPPPPNDNEDVTPNPPDQPTSENLPTPDFTPVTPELIDTSIARLELNFTRQFQTYFGLDERPIATVDDGRTLAQSIEEATGAKPAFIYVSFVPAGVNPLVADGIVPADTDQLELVLVKARGGVVRRRIPTATRKEVLAVAQTLRAEVTNPRRVNSTSYMDSSRTLYDWLVAPLEAELTLREITNLVFLSDVGLRSLPLAALHDGEQFLVQRYSIGLMPSLSLTDTRYVDIRNSQLLAMGISESTQGQSPLPAASVEVTTLALKLWRGRLFLNERATLDTLKSARQQQPFGIVHLATHADVSSNAANESYIQLWNDRLRMDQVRQLGWNDPPVNLLVLSACRTAIENTQAELGFAGLAVQTGVKTAVASLWYVSDVASAALMSSFYGFLNTAPIKAEALRSAQIAMASGQVYVENGQIRGLGITPPSLPHAESVSGRQSLAHPYYWAGFTMVGNPW